MKISIFLLTLFFLCCGINNASYEVNKKVEVVSEDNSIEEIKLFTRDSIASELKRKIKEQKPLVVHILVPLCDNENQGIVPVSASLGNGLNSSTNLYWGAAYGMKTYFKRKSDWKTISSSKPEGESILERIVFYKEFPNGAKVYLLADAYRGDKMKVCLIDFFQMISGEKTVRTEVNGQVIQSGSASDLVIFNGHNGLMDVNVEGASWTGKRRVDAAAIGCYSNSYFKPHFLKSGAYPLLTTTHLMAPEAYVTEALINSWANQNSGDTIRMEAAKAYNNWQKCGMKGAMNLFKTGW